MSNMTVDELKWLIQTFDDGVRVFVVVDGKRLEIQEGLFEPKDEYAVGLICDSTKEYKEEPIEEEDT